MPDQHEQPTTRRHIPAWERLLLLPAILTAILFVAAIDLWQSGIKAAAINIAANCDDWARGNLDHWRWQ